MKPLKILLACSLLIAVSPARAADCSPDAIKKLMADEEQRQLTLKDCAGTPADVANDGGVDGVCVMNWRMLDAAESDSAACMTDPQLEKFTHWRRLYDLHCGTILDFNVKKNYAYDSQCGESWNWLNPYEQKKRSQAAALSKIAGIDSRCAG
jgi:hypothetical protein